MNFLQFRETSLRLAHAAAKQAAKSGYESTALELLACGDHRGAAVAIKELLQRFPRESRWWHELALIQLFFEDVNGSIQSWKNALLGDLADLDLLCAICGGISRTGLVPESVVESVWTESYGQPSEAVSSGIGLSRLVLRVPSQKVAADDFCGALPAFERHWQSARGCPISTGNLSYLLRRLGDEGRAKCVLASHLLEVREPQQAVLRFESASPSIARSEEFFADYLHALRLAGQGERVMEVASLAESEHACTRGAYYEWAHTLSDANRTEEALEVLGRGVAVHDDWLLRVQALTILPPVAFSQLQLERDHQRVSRALSALVQASHDLELFCDGCDPKAIQPMFYLAYTGNDVVDELANYGALAEGVMAAAFPTYREERIQRNRSVGERLRIGYVTAHAFFHSVLRISAGWLQDYDRENFEVHLFPLNGDSDWMTEFVSRQIDVLHPHTADTGTAARQIIESDIDVLVYLEIGMSPLAFRLAALRLAPKQCSTWGHPVTSGFSTIDYFLGSEAMEPANAAVHYVERLITLPGIGVSAPMAGPADTRTSRADFGLEEGDVIYLSPQSTFKYLPEHDGVYSKIAQHVPNSVFVFIESQFPAWSETFAARLRATFVAQNLNPDRHLRFVPSQSYDRFLDLNRCSDIFIDSFGFSGFTTTFDALSCGLPVVTMPGELMRARQSYAMLCEMNISETIATNLDEYIQVAVRLGLDTVWRAEMSHKIRDRTPLLANDIRSVKGLEAFYRWAVGSPRPDDEALFKVWPKANPSHQIPRDLSKPS